MVEMEVELPEIDEIEEGVEELNLSTSTLMAAGPWLGKMCEGINNEFMLCRTENDDPRPCLELGKLVTKCSREFFQKVIKQCEQEFKQFAECVDKSSGDYRPWVCRQTMAAFSECAEERLCLKYPGFGYFTRGRIHSSGCTSKAPRPPCPCHPIIDDATDKLPPPDPECPEPPPRFGGRLFWSME